MTILSYTPVTAEEFDQTIRWMKNTLRDIVNDQKSQGPSDGYVSWVISDLAKYNAVIQVTPFEYATSFQHRVMRHKLEKGLPRMQRKLVRLFAAKKYDKAWFFTTWRLSTGIFNKIQAQATLHKHLPRVIEQRPQVLVAQVAQRPALEAKAAVTFPALSSVSGMVDVALADLRQRWERANQLPNLTTEDRFVLEQIATAYLPDSWRMFEGLRGLSPETVEEGENLLLSQVRDFTVRLDGIQDREAASSLQSLRAQTDFIHQQTPQTDKSKLNLAKAQEAEGVN